MNNILTTEISINSILMFLYTNVWSNNWVFVSLLLAIYYFGGILLRNLLAYTFKKAYEDENNKPKTYFTNDEKTLFLLSRVFFPIALVIAIGCCIIATFLWKQDKYLDKILKK